MALEKLAAEYLAQHDVPAQPGMIVIDGAGVLDPRSLFAHLFALADLGDANDIARGAALFHVMLAEAMAEWAATAAERCNVRTIAFGGGCFFNRILTSRLRAGLEQRNLEVRMPQAVSCGDAGLALGQAWVAAQQLRAEQSVVNEASLCV